MLWGERTATPVAMCIWFLWPYVKEVISFGGFSSAILVKLVCTHTHTCGNGWELATALMSVNAKELLRSGLFVNKLIMNEPMHGPVLAPGFLPISQPLTEAPVVDYRIGSNVEGAAILLTCTM